MNVQVSYDRVVAEDVNWLDSEQLQSWMTFMGLLVVLPGELDSRMQRQAGITNFEYTVMAGLSEAPGRTLRISVLAQLAQGSLSRLSHLIKRLEKQGWVRREPDPLDGRYTNAILTDAGFAKVVETAPGHVDAVRELVIDAVTPAQLRSLGEISGRILRGIHPDGDCPL
ncbi:MarR family winged helix-turn-helix transcriptional regulator [Winogradskya consettensis]|uniref:MarR family transcriptional regulator n=1 Tax=Winogradskya consettensis TaxID=113560 RepID=A0A919SGD2_9ACTN|nr:MarR family transcriptional regulator [Actinoplanes consettensis]